MLWINSIRLMTAAAALAALTVASAAETKYPNLKGQWNTLSPRGSFDPDKPRGRVQSDLRLERQGPAERRSWLGDVISVPAARHAARHDRL